MGGGLWGVGIREWQAGSSVWRRHDSATAVSRGHGAGGKAGGGEGRGVGVGMSADPVLRSVPPRREGPDRSVVLLNESRNVLLYIDGHDRGRSSHYKGRTTRPRLFWVAVRRVRSGRTMPA